MIDAFLRELGKTPLARIVSFIALIAQPVLVLFFATRDATWRHTPELSFGVSMLFITAFYFLISRAYRIEQPGRLLFFLGAALLFDTVMCLFIFERFAIAHPDDREIVTQLSNAILLFGGAVGANTIFASFERFGPPKA